jgi:hypothetical protein
MHAVYVPTRVGPTGMAELEAAASGDWSGGTLLLSLVGRPVPHRTRLTAAQLRRVVRQWARAVRAGEGTLRLGDERRVAEPLPAAPRLASRRRGARRHRDDGTS